MPSTGGVNCASRSHQIILVAAERRAGVMIDVVLDEGDALAGAERFQRSLQQLIARKVVGHDVAQTEAFGRGIFDVAHVEVNAAAIEQEAAVARRFLVVAIMQIQRAGPGFPEQVIFDPRRPAFAAALRPFAANEAAILRLDPHDPVHVEEHTPSGGRLCQEGLVRTGAFPAHCCRPGSSIEA